MNTMPTKMRNGVIRLATWYRTPGGLLSLLFIAVALGFVIAGLNAAAIVTAIGWVAIMLPHKLTRERRDWENALERNRVTAAVQTNGLRSELASMDGVVGRLDQDLSSMPTVEEIRTWQGSIEATQQVSNERMVADIAASAALVDEQSERNSILEATVSRSEQATDEIGERADRLKATIDELEGEMAALNERFAGLQQEMSNRMRIDPLKVSAEVQSIGGLYSLLEPTLPLPPLGGWAISPEASLVLARAISRNQPELVVEAGSGSSTVVAALALAKVGHGRVIALEHDSGYAVSTRQLLRDRGLEKYATVVDAPLREYKIGGETYQWYDVAEDLFNAPIELLLVDGPPGTTGPVARFPAVPLLLEHLTSSANVMVDDAGRPAERKIVDMWQEKYNLYRVDQTKDGELAILRFAAEPTH